jgi:hypothetical protein
LGPNLGFAVFGLSEKLNIVAVGLAVGGDGTADVRGLSTFAGTCWDCLNVDLVSKGIFSITMAAARSYLSVTWNQCGGRIRETYLVVLVLVTHYAASCYGGLDVTIHGTFRFSFVL